MQNTAVGRLVGEYPVFPTEEINEIGPANARGRDFTRPVEKCVEGGHYVRQTESFGVIAPDDTDAD
ncbi:hypothetical protein PC129_g17964 [Phytophthora cactorum]|uniref:Uncharacterized protein n=1 Tax=Phytophthora cactorum TaxID=29920 RepID=A0A8T1JF05_9STRA|nr:hypothetical protein PC112_g24055 [Phytophthora cactorum]KAG2871543.1 hypothetical protein PC114_g26862 [Phytophthora cactorum]KAG2879397.1 hypothetical protein PC117_g26776 [Phytophthora cactorum]KAG2959841.1 hypothetical protein PC119_g26586 [Phytophthora cactorum]KAG2969994.1 hypothetical protein PC120_g26636 [Phytophthora cactorum]